MADETATAALCAWLNQPSEYERALLFKLRLDAFALDHPDFDDVVGAPEVGRVPIPDHVMQFIATHPAGPNVCFYLAQNLNVCRRITYMPEDQALSTLERLASRLLGPKLTLVHNAVAEHLSQELIHG